MANSRAIVMPAAPPPTMQRSAATIGIDFDITRIREVLIFHWSRIPQPREVFTESKALLPVDMQPYFTLGYPKRQSPMQAQRHSFIRIAGGCGLGVLLCIAGPLIAPLVADQKLGDVALVAHWNFEEGSGNTIKDLSGNGNHGKIISANVREPKWGSGKFTDSMYFNESTFVRISSSESLNRLKKQITVVAHIYPKSLWNSSFYCTASTRLEKGRSLCRKVVWRGGQQRRIRVYLRCSAPVERCSSPRPILLRLRKGKQYSAL